MHVAKLSTAEPYSRRDRLHQLFPDRAGAQWRLFIERALRGKFGKDVRGHALMFVRAAPSALAAEAMVSLQPAFTEWAEEDAIAAMEAHGIVECWK